MSGLNGTPGERVNSQGFRGFESHLLRTNFMSKDGRDSQLLGYRWDEKPAAMCEFSLNEVERKGKHREGRTARNFRQEIYL